MTEIIKPSRRSFITGLSALIVAPAIVKITNIMPVKVIQTPEEILGIVIDHIWYEEAKSLNEVLIQQMLYSTPVNFKMNEAGKLEFNRIREFYV
jgi:hypothetical protein